MSLKPRLALGITLAVLASVGILESLRFAYAEKLAHSDTVTALQSALQVAPGNAGYHARIAVLDATRNDELDLALNLNPREPSWWILRAVHQEEESDLSGAEHSLERANVVSQYYIPRWSLAAFYYRQGNRAKFLEWGQRALSAGWGTPDSLTRMAQKLGLSSVEILNDLIPRTADRVNSYLHLVLADGDRAATYQAALELMDLGSKLDRGSVLAACDTLFGANQIDEAVETWNRAVKARWIDSRRLDPETGVSLGSETFAKPSLQQGFDWRYAAIPGVSMSASEGDSSLRFEFSGSEPETCELLSQPVPLKRDSRYRLAFRYRAEGITEGSGLQWRVQAVDGGQSVMSGPLELPAQAIAEHTLVFRTPPQQLPMRIVLAYSRAPGTTRIQGRLSLESVKLELVP